MVFTKKIHHSKIVQDYIDNLNPGTDIVYSSSLDKLETFCELNYGNIEKAIEGIRKKKIKIFDFFIKFKNAEINKNTNTKTKKERVNTAANFIEDKISDYDPQFEISRRLLKKKLHWGNEGEREKFSLDRKTVIKILSACTNPRLKAYLHLLAAIGCRPKQEALSLRIKDVMFNDERPYIHFPLKITKTDHERNTFMTNELIQVLNTWIAHKYRERNQYDGKSPTVKITPKRDDNRLLFSIHQDSTVHSIHNILQSDFYKLLKDLNLDGRHDDQRHLITFKTFRDFVKSQISHEGQEQYSEYHIGHKNNSYWSRTEEDKYETFKLIEPSITYFNIDNVAAFSQNVKKIAQDQSEEIIQLKQELETLRNERDQQMETFRAEVKDQIKWGMSSLVYEEDLSHLSDEGRKEYQLKKKKQEQKNNAWLTRMKNTSRRKAISVTTKTN